MDRNQRLANARETVAIVGHGGYRDAAGREVSIADALAACLAGTRHFAAEAMAPLQAQVLAQPAPGFATRLALANETTLAGIATLLAEPGGPVAALNFASARNPGGGFLGGAEAQEESLARSSALHASLLRAEPFYARHRAQSSLLYSDAMILSPRCPVFRDDAGALLPTPQEVAFLTSPAPNAGAIAANQPHDAARVPETLRRRAGYVLALAAAHGYTRLVLGAWGCGVFRNDPALVAATFVDALRGPWAGRFEQVRFSVLDRSPAQATYAAFERALASP
jgi:uncharacterized protein (TIGR02452 family)